MGSRAGRKLSVVVVAALVATTLSGVSGPPAGAGAGPCPVPASGHWTGYTISDITDLEYPVDANLNFGPGGAISGTVTAGLGGPFPVSGTVTCGVISFGTVSPNSTFEGAFAADGRSGTGPYDALEGADVGQWFITADPYVLTATSTVQPTTIAPLGASSWVVDVENTGSAAATLVQTKMPVSGSGVPGPVSQYTVSQGSGCHLESGGSTIVCDLGTILPGGEASVSVTVVSTGGAGTSILLEAAASSVFPGGGTDGSAAPMTISVVAPANLPPNIVSGIAKPGVTFATPGKATPANPIVVKFKLPKKVAAGSVAGKRRATRKQRPAGGISLVSFRSGRSGHATRSALGRPSAATVRGPSVPMTIDESASEALTFCGGAACSGDVVHLTAFAGYNDRKRPAKVTITWDKSRAGRGINSSIFKRADARSAPLQTLPQCRKSKLGFVNLPCISKRKLVSGGDVMFLLLVLSGDPKFGRR